MKAWTYEADKLLLSNIKDLKGFISHFYHNFLIYLNYHHINIIIRYYYDLDFVYKCTFISCFSEFLNFLFFQNFDLIFTFSDQKIHQIYYALIILLFIMYIIFIFKGCFDFDTLFSFFPLSPQYVLLLSLLCYYHIISVYMYISKS